MTRVRAGWFPRALAAVSASVLSAVASAQDMELQGRVVDDRGAAVANADVTFLPLPARARPRSGHKARYRVAQAAHRAGAKMPRTRTDRDGAFRCLVSPHIAALASGSGVEMAMRVSAPGHVTWMRAIGDDLSGANGVVATLPRAAARPSPRLEIRVQTAVDGSYRGVALIERAYRARPDRSVWLRDVVPIDPLGRVTFDEPARMPGEVPALLPTARAEGYRVTLYVAGLDRWQHTLTEGSHEVRPERSDLPPRRVLAERGEPARAPVQATYEIGDEEMTFAFDQPLVPLLGGEVPVRVTSASGPVVVDAWDPDVAMFVESAAIDKEGPAAPAGAAPQTAERRSATFTILDRRRQPLFGAALWLEDQSARTLLADQRPYAVSDPTGTARLVGLRPGTHWVLVRHPRVGEREVLLDTVHEGPIEVVLRESANATGETDLEAQPGSLLLDLEQRGASDEAVDVGIVQGGRRVVRRGFDERPRLVRLEGLVPGPVTVWVKVGEGPAHIISGALATELDEPPMHPLRAPVRSFVLEVRAHDGKPADDVFVSLGEAAPRGRPPLTASLLPLTRDEATGRYTLGVHLTGDLWVVVHGAGDTRRDVLLGEGAAPVVSVQLPEPAPEPETKDGKDADGAPGERKREEQNQGGKRTS
ncbi:MAG: carboxypeptidase-like regulatory domain-containing protein [Planctomycetota bacterium]